MNRVGCMPCVNCSKGELLEIYKRFPEHVERIAEWERVVRLASKRGEATFLPSTGETEGAFDRGNIYKQVEWSQTKRGGAKFDIFSVFEDPAACSSSYDLCE